jgi:hypothetical protein
MFQHSQHGTQQEAVEAQMKLLLSSPGVETFKTLREVGKKAGNWETLRPNALKALEREEKISALIEIALNEGDVARALALLPRVKTGGWNFRDYKWEVGQRRRSIRRRPSRSTRSWPRAPSPIVRAELTSRPLITSSAKKLAERLNGGAEW